VGPGSDGSDLVLWLQADRVGTDQRRQPQGALPASIVVAALAGCSGDDPPPPPICPQVGIINGLEHEEHAAADGSGRLAYRASMENVEGACRVEGGDLVVDIAIDLIVQPGPAVPGSLVELPYFVAISGPSGALIDRQDFVARVEMPRGARRAGVTETFAQRFVGREAGATQYQVLFGFDLPESEALRQYRGG
jgi:hypothetical protein